MFSKLHTHFLAATLMTFGLAGSLTGIMPASAQTITASSTQQLVVEGGAPAAAGAVLTVQGAGFAANESISLWINVPDGTSIAQDALGETNAAIVGTVIPLDTPASADAYGAFTYSLNTSGLPAGSYSLVAHGQSSNVDEVSPLIISGTAAAQAPSGSASTLAAGSMLNVQGTGYTVGEPISFWVNIPSGATASANSLGQGDTATDGSVITVDAIASADAYGAFAYSLNTSGLPAGNYSVVAHGMTSGIEQVTMFTISGAAPSATSHFIAAGSTTVAAGTMLTFQGTAYQADEPVGLWVNVPARTTISNDALGQTDTTIDGSVIPLNAMAATDDNGAFTYSLNTNGLPSGSYSIVAHGLNSEIEGVITFTIQ